MSSAGSHRGLNQPNRGREKSMAAIPLLFILMRYNFKQINSLNILLQEAGTYFFGKSMIADKSGCTEHINKFNNHINVGERKWTHFSGEDR